VSFAAITLCVVSQRVIPKVRLYFFITQSGNFWTHSRILLYAYYLIDFFYFDVKAVRSMAYNGLLVVVSVLNTEKIGLNPS
jgi:hypothetical protein